MTTEYSSAGFSSAKVVEAYRLDRYDNFLSSAGKSELCRCRSLSFG